MNISRRAAILLCAVGLCAGLSAAGAEGGELADARLKELLAALPRLGPGEPDQFTPFQFECRIDVTLDKDRVRRFRCIVERLGDHYALLLLSDRGLPLLIVNREGMVASSVDRPGEVEYAKRVRFAFRLQDEPHFGIQMSLQGPATVPSEADVDLRAILHAAAERSHESRFDPLKQSLQLGEPDGGPTTTIRLRHGSPRGFPIESIEIRSRRRGLAIVLTNFFVGNRFPDGGSGPRSLTTFGRDDLERHPAEALPHAELSDAGLQALLSASRIAAADDDPRLVAAGERIESWILPCLTLRVPVPAILEQEPLALPPGFFPQRRWFKRLAFELSDNAVLTATNVGPQPLRMEPVGYSRASAAAHVEAWLGYRRTQRLYDFLLRTIADPGEEKYNRVSAMATLERIGLPAYETDLSALGPAPDDLPDLIDCWSACRLLLREPRPADVARAKAAVGHREAPVTVRRMAVMGLAVCGESADPDQFVDDFLAELARQRDGSLSKEDVFYALATVPPGQRHLLSALADRTLGLHSSSSALLALDELIEPPAPERKTLLETARAIALDDDLVSSLRAAAAQVCAGRPSDKEFLAAYLQELRRTRDPVMIRCVPLAGDQLELLLDAETGLPSLLAAEDSAARFAAMATITDILRCVEPSQALADALAPAHVAMLEAQDPAFILGALDSQVVLHGHGLELHHDVIDKMIEQIRRREDPKLLSALVVVLGRVSGRPFLEPHLALGQNVSPSEHPNADWWRSRRKSILAEIDRWWESAGEARNTRPLA